MVIYDAEDVPDPLQLKNAALRNPAASGDWIIKQPVIAGSLDDPPDLIAQQITKPSFSLTIHANCARIIGDSPVLSANSRVTANMHIGTRHAVHGASV